MQKQSQTHLYQHIMDLINQKRPNSARVVHYPFYKISSSYEIEIKESTKQYVQNILKYVEAKTIPKNKTFSEYGLKDTFVRTEIAQSTQLTRTYFRREQHMFCEPSFDGLFVIEMYNLCEESDIPYIVDYPHRVHGAVSQYDVGSTTVRFTQYTQPEQNRTYVDVSSNIDINNITDSMTDFFDSIKTLKEDINRR